MQHRFQFPTSSLVAASLLTCILALLYTASCSTLGSACDSDLGCARGQICVTKQCKEGCRSDLSCRAGLYCTNNQCGELRCNPGEQRPCFDGPLLMVGVGACRYGVQFCTTKGQWSQCSGQIGSQAETCDRVDNDCNGKIDDGLDCQCKPGIERQCYTGPKETRGGNKPCKAGIQTCLVDNRWGTCRGQRLPLPEKCGINDNDCDGRVDNGLDCKCTAGSKRECYTGPPNTSGSGICRSGEQVCQANGEWGSCKGERLPATENCDGKDNDCNGRIDDLASGQSCQSNDAGPDELTPVDEPTVQDLPREVTPEPKPTEQPTPDLPKPPGYKVLGRNATPTDIAVDTQKNAYVVGSFKGPAEIGGEKLSSNNNTSDMFIAKFNNAGGLVWLIQLNGAGEEKLNGITFDRLGQKIYVIGETSSTTLISRRGTSKNTILNRGTQTNTCAIMLSFSTNGTFLDVNYDKAGEFSRGIQIEINGNELVAIGQFRETAQFTDETTPMSPTGTQLAWFILRLHTKLNITAREYTDGVADATPQAMTLKIQKPGYKLYVAGEITGPTKLMGRRELNAWQPLQGKKTTILLRWHLQTDIRMDNATRLYCTIACNIHALAHDATQLYAAGTFSGAMQQAHANTNASALSGVELFFGTMQLTLPNSNQFKTLSISKTQKAGIPHESNGLSVTKRQAFMGGSIGATTTFGGNVTRKGKQEAIFTRMALSGTGLLSSFSSGNTNKSKARITALHAKTNSKNQDELWLTGTIEDANQLMLGNHTLTNPSSDQHMFLIKMTQ